MKEYSIRSSFLDRQRKLVLDDNYLAWENGDLKGSEFVRIEKSDIVDFKHGIDWIVWYKFTVGRKFSVTIKGKRNKELKIQFNSYFGLNKENHQKYSNVIDEIWRLYHSNIVDGFLDSFYNHLEIEIQGIKLKSDGLKLKGATEMVPWDKVATKEYYGYFAIYHRDNPVNHSRVSYNEYGTETLWGVLTTILRGNK